MEKGKKTKMGITLEGLVKSRIKNDRNVDQDTFLRSIHEMQEGEHEGPPKVCNSFP